ncbi:MAG: diguanylate cyclase, partial [Sulfuriferula sp.]
MKLSSWPLWLKILTAALSVQTLVLLALGYTTITSFNQALLQQNQTRLTELRTLLNANIASALFQRDVAGIHQLFTRIQRDDGIAYLHLVDDTGHLVATAGAPIEDAVHQTLDIKIDHLTLGKLDFDLSTADANRAQQALIWRGFLVAGVTITIAFILLLLLSVWLTRRLRQLTAASDALTTGNLYVKLPDTSHDEVGKLNTAFNSMANTLQQRISDLHALHTQQQDNLHLAQAEQARLTALLAAMNLGILFVDNHGEILYCNPAFRDIWQPHHPDQIKGQLATSVLNSTHAAISNPAAFSDHIARIAKPGSGAGVLEIDMADGRIVTHTIRSIHSNDGETIGSLWIFEDITHERHTAAQLIYLAERDTLTGLYNRRSFENALHDAFQEHARSTQTGALLFIDLDGFKYINDSFGHYAGDETLIRIAGIMSALVRAGEELYRLGGDEFAILLNSASQTDAQTL